MTRKRPRSSADSPIGDASSHALFPIVQTHFTDPALSHAKQTSGAFPPYLPGPALQDRDEDAMDIEDMDGDTGGLGGGDEQGFHTMLSRVGWRTGEHDMEDDDIFAGRLTKGYKRMKLNDGDTTVGGLVESYESPFLPKNNVYTSSTWSRKPEPATGEDFSNSRGASFETSSTKGQGTSRSYVGHAHLANQPFPASTAFPSPSPFSAVPHHTVDTNPNLLPPPVSLPPTPISPDLPPRGLFAEMPTASKVLPPVKISLRTPSLTTESAGNSNAFGSSTASAGQTYSASGWTPRPWGATLSPPTAAPRPLPPRPSDSATSPTDPSSSPYAQINSLLGSIHAGRMRRGRDGSTSGRQEEQVGSPVYDISGGRAGTHHGQLERVQEERRSAPSVYPKWAPPEAGMPVHQWVAPQGRMSGGGSSGMSGVESG
ncbi:hypothetical protein M427DRAFT_153148 [Gonapodya prolifera JEL478]|uniref:Uncharacterized protein n=1 Tax=Gonapodya prolifera (strain JEL478) TaxID=1344416 RepID=A0A139ANM1_GONPJ|nr:hypothetical protein M427DRAFT_153148 [Gonapodya prolifera JEL478]|eukprot:KXS18336.1 hypothetical protein M427DRAFT_153148 [Gonapodya prolifera JEL478]